MTEPTAHQIAAATGGYVDDDGTHVVVNYGADGYLRLRPTTLTTGGVAGPAAMIEGQLRQRHGQRCIELRRALRIAGIVAARRWVARF